MQNDPKDLLAAIRQYQQGHGLDIHEMRRHFEGLTLWDAIWASSAGLSKIGRINGHQRRIGYALCEQAAEELVLKIASIGRCKTFDEIFSITEGIKHTIHGLGDLWSYDAALRIGFNMQIYPSKVFVQRGVFRGLAKLGVSNRGRGIDYKDLPRPLQVLTCYEIENFLCVWGKAKT